MNSAYSRNVFWKEDLAPVMDEKIAVQELPDAFNRVLEEQKKWQSVKKAIQG